MHNDDDRNRQTSISAIKTSLNILIMARRFTWIRPTRSGGKVICLWMYGHAYEWISFTLFHPFFVCVAYFVVLNKLFHIVLPHHVDSYGFFLFAHFTSIMVYLQSNFVWVCTSVELFSIVAVAVGMHALLTMHCITYMSHHNHNLLAVFGTWISAEQANTHTQIILLVLNLTTVFGAKWAGKKKYHNLCSSLLVPLLSSFLLPFAAECVCVWLCIEIFT